MAAKRKNPRKRGRVLSKAKRIEYAEFKDSEFRQHLRSHSGGRRSKSRKTHGNPVKVAASMTGKSTGWMPAKAVRVVKGKGGQVRVDVKR